MLTNAVNISAPLAGGRDQRLMLPSESPLWQAAQKLEAHFLAEMLKGAGLGQTSASFGGGAGEDQFASFLRSEQAAQMARAGGIGLAETFFEALKEQSYDG